MQFFAFFFFHKLRNWFKIAQKLVDQKKATFFNFHSKITMVFLLLTHLFLVDLIEFLSISSKFVKARRTSFLLFMNYKMKWASLSCEAEVAEGWQCYFICCRCYVIIIIRVMLITLCHYFITLVIRYSICGYKVH